MSEPIKLHITKAGLTAFFNAKANGIYLQIDKMKYSSDNFESVSMDDRTELNNIVSESNIVASGTDIKNNTIRFVTVINSTSELHIGSMGVYTKEGVLFAVASVANGALFKVYNGISFTATFGIALNAQLLEQIAVILDPNTALAFSMVNDHENHVDPHPQYAKNSEVIDAINQINNELDGLGGGQGDLSGQLFGINQDYHQVASERRNDGTVYINPYNKPMLVTVTFNLNDYAGWATVVSNGKLVTRLKADTTQGSVYAYVPLTFMVGPKKGYTVTGGVVVGWTEYCLE